MAGVVIALWGTVCRGSRRTHAAWWLSGWFVQIAGAMGDNACNAWCSVLTAESYNSPFSHVVAEQHISRAPNCTKGEHFTVMFRRPIFYRTVFDFNLIFGFESIQHWRLYTSSVDKTTNGCVIQSGSKISQIDHSNVLHQCGYWCYTVYEQFSEYFVSKIESLRHSVYQSAYRCNHSTETAFFILLLILTSAHREEWCQICPGLKARREREREKKERERTMHWDTGHPEKILADPENWEWIHEFSNFVGVEQSI